MSVSKKQIRPHPASETTTDAETLGERRGMPIYRTNPSIDGLPMQIKNRTAKIVSGQKALLYDDATGEVAGEGSVAFIEREVVDPEKFIKLYVAGLDGMFKLKGAGQRVFKVLWMQAQANPDSDRVELNHYIAEDCGDKITERVFQRGVRELLEKEFIYNSPTPGLFFYNVRFLFNGNRILTAKEYVLRGTQEQQALDFDEK